MHTKVRRSVSLLHSHSRTSKREVKDSVRFHQFSVMVQSFNDSKQRRVECAEGSPHPAVRMAPSCLRITQAKLQRCRLSTVLSTKHRQVTKATYAPSYSEDKDAVLRSTNSEPPKPAGATRIPGLQEFVGSVCMPLIMLSPGIST